MRGFAAIVLAGGAGRRLGGAAKPALPVAGRSMLDRVLRAVTDATPVVLVGTPAEPPAGVLTTLEGPSAGVLTALEGLPAGVLTTVEDPPGSGPVAATAAGVTLLPRDAADVALLAADLPFLTQAAIARLRQRLAASTVDGALYVDGDGRRQLLCGVWRAPSLLSAIDRLAAGRGLAGASMRALFADLEVGEVAWTEPGPPPWFDCDTDEDLRQAEEWAR